MIASQFPHLDESRGTGTCPLNLCGKARAAQEEFLSSSHFCEELSVCWFHQGWIVTPALLFSLPDKKKYEVAVQKANGTLHWLATEYWSLSSLVVRWMEKETTWRGRLRPCGPGSGAWAWEGSLSKVKKNDLFAQPAWAEPSCLWQADV